MFFYVIKNEKNEYLCLQYRKWCTFSDMKNNDETDSMCLRTYNTLQGAKKGISMLKIPYKKIEIVECKLNEMSPILEMEKSS